MSDVKSIEWNEKKREAFFKSFGARKKQKQLTIDLIERKKKQKVKRDKKGKRRKVIGIFKDEIEKIIQEENEFPQFEKKEIAYGNGAKVTIEPMSVENEEILKDLVSEEKKNKKKTENSDVEGFQKNDENFNPKEMLPEYLKGVPELFLLDQKDIEQIKKKQFLKKENPIQFHIKTKSSIKNAKLFAKKRKRQDKKTSKKSGGPEPKRRKTKR